jgi:hypothetical protein
LATSNVQATCGIQSTTLRPQLSKIGYIINNGERVIVDYSGRGRTNIKVREHDAQIFDLRPRAKQISLDQAGFQLFDYSSPAAVNWTSSTFDVADLQASASDYHADMAAFVRAQTGARDVVALRNGLFLRKQKKKQQEGERVASTFAHIDFSAQAARDFVLVAMAWEGIQEIDPYSRLLVIQSWHVLTPPPQDFPLVFCDNTSVQRSDLFFIDYIPPPGRVDIRTESHAVAYNPAHRWYYFSDMTPDEVILFKGFDSMADKYAGAPPHTSFKNVDAPATVGARASIEARFLCFFE